VKCPVCEEKGYKSEVTEGKSIKTFEPGGQTFEDSKGRNHSHDPSVITTGFRCSQGHGFVKSWIVKCPYCDFGDGQFEITIIDNIDGPGEGIE
jgi:hypothetical protein